MTGDEIYKSIIPVGKTKIGLICPSSDYAEGLNAYFQCDEKEQNADIWLTLTITAENREIDLCDSLFLTKQADGNSFFMGRGLVKGTFDPEKKEGSINVHYALTSDVRTKVFEQIIFQAFYTAIKYQERKQYLVHSCGIIKNNKGYLFIGKSGSGKSTIAELSKEYTILNDEICLVDCTEEKITLHSTPFNGLFKDKKRGDAILDSLFLLNHSKKHRVVPLSAGKAIQAVISEIVPPMGLQDGMSEQLKKKMFAIASELVTRCPVYMLHFSPDAGFWQEIDKQGD